MPGASIEPAILAGIFCAPARWNLFSNADQAERLVASRDTMLNTTTTPVILERLA
jgi:hypothetical protein